jgi:hypothetical protein
MKQAVNGFCRVMGCASITGKNEGKTNVRYHPVLSAHEGRLQEDFEFLAEF